MGAILGYHWSELIKCIVVKLNLPLLKLQKAIKKSEVDGYPCGYV